MTPSARAAPLARSATTSGVPPTAEMPSTIPPSSCGVVPPLSRTHWATDEAAPVTLKMPRSTFQCFLS